MDWAKGEWKEIGLKEQVKMHSNLDPVTRGSLEEALLDKAGGFQELMTMAGTVMNAKMLHFLHRQSVDVTKQVLEWVKTKKVKPLSTFSGVEVKETGLDSPLKYKTYKDWTRDAR